MQPLADLLAKPGAKQAAANLGWLVFERGVRFALGLVVGVFVVRYLGPERLGALSYCLAVVTLLGCFPALGIDGPLKRDLLQRPDGAPGLLLGAALVRFAVAAATFAVLACMVVLNWGVTGEERSLLLIVGLLLFQPALWIPDAWLQARLRARAVVVVQLAALSIASAGRLWLIAQEASVAAFAWLLVAEMTLGAAGILWVARRDGLRLTWAAVDLGALKRLLGDAWPLMLASLAILVYMKIDEVMLRHLAGPAAVGTYAAAVRLSEVWYFIPTAIASSVLPALLRARAADPASYRRRLQQYYDLSAALAYGLSIPIALSAPWIVRFMYGAPFADAGPILAVHIWASVFVFLGTARGQWLVNEGLSRFYLAATGAGALANVGLNLVFIPKWGGLGAAWATLASYALAAWIASYFHPAVRETAAFQTRALLIPLRGWRYLRRP